MLGAERMKAIAPVRRSWRPSSSATQPRLRKRGSSGLRVPLSEVVDATTDSNEYVGLVREGCQRSF